MKDKSAPDTRATEQSADKCANRVNHLLTISREVLSQGGTGGPSTTGDQEHEEAAWCRADVAEEMTAREVAEAQRRARQWLSGVARKAA